jgi:hypothetical protein
MSPLHKQNGTRSSRSHRRSKSRIRNLSDIRIWLLPVFGLLLALEIVLAFSAVRFWHLQQTALLDQKKLFFANENLAQAQQSSTQLGRLSFQATMSPDSRNLEEYRNHILKKSLADSKDQPVSNLLINPLLQVGQTLRKLKSPMAALGDAERERFERLSEEFASLLRIDEKTLATLEGRFEDNEGRFTVEKEPDPEMARNLLRDQSYQIRRSRLNEDLASMRAVLDVRILSLLAEISRHSTLFFPLALATIALLLVATPSLGWFLRRHISESIDTHKKQIRKMNEEFSRLRGQLSVLEIERNEHSRRPPAPHAPAAETPSTTPVPPSAPSLQDLPISSSALPSRVADEYLTRMP